MEADGSRFTVCPLCPLGYLPRKSTSCAVAVLPSHSLLKLAGRMEKPVSRFAPHLGQAPRILHDNKFESRWGDDFCATRKGDPAHPLPQPISDKTQHVRRRKTFGKTSENRIACAKLTCDFRYGGRSNNAYDVCVMYECLECTDRPERHRAEESKNINTSANSRRAHQNFATPPSTNDLL